MVAGLWIFLSAFYGMALIYFAGLGQAAVVALPFVGIGLFLIRKAWTYR